MCFWKFVDLLNSKSWSPKTQLYPMTVNTALLQPTILSSCFYDVFTFQISFLLILSANPVPPTNPAEDVVLIFLFSIISKPLPGEWHLTALEVLSGAVSNSGITQEYSIRVVVTQPKPYFFFFQLFVLIIFLVPLILCNLHTPLLYSHTGVLSDILTD